jgi:hypothetical protein
MRNSAYGGSSCAHISIYQETLRAAAACSSGVQQRRAAAACSSGVQQRRAAAACSSAQPAESSRTSDAARCHAASRLAISVSLDAGLTGCVYPLHMPARESSYLVRTGGYSIEYSNFNPWAIESAEPAAGQNKIVEVNALSIVTYFRVRRMHTMSCSISLHKNTSFLCCYHSSMHK